MLTNPHNSNTQGDYGRDPQPFLSRFAHEIEALTDQELQNDAPLPRSLCIDQENRLAAYYAPFDHVNQSARIVLVGITPGREQMNRALRVFRDSLRAGDDLNIAASKAKLAASFSGAMRTNLVAMLGHFGVHQLLGVNSASDLFGSASHLVHYTSVLRYPIFKDRKNYSGRAPRIGKSPMLRRHLQEYFGAEAIAMHDALFVPLGSAVTEALDAAAKLGFVASESILRGLEHPSGANVERILYLLERKARSALSAQVNADRIDRARSMLRCKINQLRTSGLDAALI